MSKFHSVKESDFIDGVYTLMKNTPKLVFPKHNEKRFKIYEDSTNETLYIVFNLNNSEHALIGRECHKPKEGSKVHARTDLMCIYSKPSYEIAFAYDLKKTLGGKDVILGLISQWVETISYCKTLTEKTDYIFSVGVVTEKFNHNLLNNGIHELRKRIQESDNRDFNKSSIARKRRASSTNNSEMLKRLLDFRDGKVEVENLVLDIDICYFEINGDQRELTLQFNGGDRPQVLRFATQSNT